MKKKNSNSTKTVLVISIGFSVIFLLFSFKWALYTAIVIGVLGIISNKICDIIDYLWMKLASLLGLIVPNILLSLIFYLFLFPLAILSRISRSKNALQLKNIKETTWIEKTKVNEKHSFEKMW